MKYFSHYKKEIQTTKAKFKDYIARNDSETENLIESKDFSGGKDNMEVEAGGTKMEVEVVSLQNSIEDDPLDEKARLIRDILKIFLRK